MKLNKELFDNPNGIQEFLKNGTEFYFDSTLCKILKELKFNYETEGHYSKKVFVCRIEDNYEMIEKHCTQGEDINLYFMMCFPALAFATSIIDIPKEFIESNDLKPWHVGLIRKTLFDLSRGNTEHSYTNSNCEIYIGDKRPYGNSNVTGDIAEEYFEFNKEKVLDYKGFKFKWNEEEEEEDYPDDIDLGDVQYFWCDENADFFWNIMDETNYFIERMLREIDYSYYKFIRSTKNQGFFGGYYTSDWSVCETTYIRKNRKIKLENLVGDE